MAIGGDGLVLEATETEGAAFRLGYGLYKMVCSTWVAAGSPVELEIRLDGDDDWQKTGDAFKSDSELACVFYGDPFSMYRFVASAAGPVVKVTPLEVGQEWPTGA